MRTATYHATSTLQLPQRERVRTAPSVRRARPQPALRACRAGLPREPVGAQPVGATARSAARRAVVRARAPQGDPHAGRRTVPSPCPGGARGMATLRTGTRAQPRRAERHGARLLHGDRRAKHRSRPLRARAPRASRHPDRTRDRLRLRRDRPTPRRRHRHQRRRASGTTTRRHRDPGTRHHARRVRRAERSTVRFDEAITRRRIDWSTVPLVLPAHGLARDYVDEWLDAKAITPTIYAEIEGHEAILALVALGCGVGVVPKLVLENSALRDRITEIPTRPALSPFPRRRSASANAHSPTHSSAAVWNA